MLSLSLHAPVRHTLSETSYNFSASVSSFEKRWDRTDVANRRWTVRKRMRDMLAYTPKSMLYRRQLGDKGSRTHHTSLAAVSRAWKNNPTQPGLKPRELDGPGWHLDSTSSNQYILSIYYVLGTHLFLRKGLTWLTSRIVSRIRAKKHNEVP